MNTQGPATTSPVSTTMAIALVGVAAIAAVVIPTLAAPLWGSGSDVYLRVAFVVGALYPGTVALIGRHAARPGTVTLAAVLAPFPMMLVVIGGVGGLMAGAIGAFGVGIAITMASAASRSGGRVATSFGYVAGALGIVVFLVGPVMLLSPIRW